MVWERSSAASGGAHIALAIVLLLGVALASFIGTTAWAQSTFSGGTIDSVRVEGTERIDPATVLSYMSVRPGDPFDPERIDTTLKSLFRTQLFADIALRRSADTLIVSVVENPIINRIAFEGNDRVDDEELTAEVQLRPRVVYTRSRVQTDVQRILDIYRRNGRFGASVDPKVIMLDQNRVDLVFEIDEGPVTRVRRIAFVGNQVFGDAMLLDQIQTEETEWYKILTTNDTYDPDRLTFDRELLRRFYLSQGYADFRVISAIGELSPDRRDFFVTFTVEEGERYRFGKITVDSRLRNLDAELLRPQLATVEGDWYNADLVEQTITGITDAVGDLQFAFVDVRPRVSRDREARTIDIVYLINESPRVFIERINISGNDRTLDEVIRREFLLAEGDPFNRSKIQRSEQQIRDLDFFERVEVTTSRGSAPDKSVIDVRVEEKPTGELSIGAGFSTTEGPLADFSVRERNLLGRGQTIGFSTTLSGRRQFFDVSFTEPYFLDRDLSFGFDVFHVVRDRQSESSFDERNTGFSLAFSYPLQRNLRQRVGYRLEFVEIDDVGSDASRFIQDQEGQSVTSEVFNTFTYDTRNSRVNPTDGYVVRLTNDLAGVGGSTRHLRTRLGGTIYFPIIEDAVTLSTLGEVGYIVGLDDDIAINDRFFLGGDNLRGFETSGVGPRDESTGDALGGNQFYRGSLELDFPLGLPEEFGLSGHAFTDFGSLTNVDESGSEIQDVSSVRVGVGAGVSWLSPLGPVRVDLAYPVVKEEFDNDEIFRFSLGARF